MVLYRLKYFLPKVLVDICTLCEGIYFDRGELEDLLQKNAEEGLGFFRRLLGVGD